MAYRQYRFNPQTFTYEVIAAPFKIRFYRVLRKILIGFILASIVNLLFSYFFYTPKMYRIARDNRELVFQYNLLQDKIAAGTRKLSEIKHRDNNVYRSLFAADTLNVPGLYDPYPDSHYARLDGDPYARLMTDAWRGIDGMARLLYLESLSLDDMQLLARDKEAMALAIPAIWPLDRNKLRGNIGRFGMRLHPILKRYIGHEGIDLGSTTGVPVYATGNGIVTTDRAVAGYGKQVLLDHGFGYKTRYAHLSKVLVAPGQQVKRGEIIGEVGSTGRSTGPHLHYEVIYRGRHVDPMNYFRRDMSEEEFTRIIESAKATTYEAD
ncbi:MAG: M23 family metallopeptidase [Rikenellaceae bacterium]|nr:M23 family metallopeptidase [Rikenellaceae bacterium]